MGSATCVLWFAFARPNFQVIARKSALPLSIKEQIFPELRLFPDAESRKDAWRTAYTKNESLGAFHFVFVPAGMIVIYIIGGSRDWFAFALLAGLPAAMILVACTLFRGSIRTKLRLELHHYGVRVCIECGHQLGSTESRICPECGAATFGNRGPPN